MHRCGLWWTGASWYHGQYPCSQLIVQKMRRESFVLPFRLFHSGHPLGWISCVTQSYLFYALILLVEGWKFEQTFSIRLVFRWGNLKHVSTNSQKRSSHAGSTQSRPLGLMHRNCFLDAPDISVKEFSQQETHFLRDLQNCMQVWL